MSVEVFTRPTQYEVTAWPGPSNSTNRYLYVLHVEWRGESGWCVTDGFGCYRADGAREYEPIPSSRDDKFKSRTRFPLDEALKLAKSIAPTMTVNGKTGAECWEWEKQ